MRCESVKSEIADRRNSIDFFLFLFSSCNPLVSQDSGFALGSQQRPVQDLYGSIDVASAFFEDMTSRANCNKNIDFGKWRIILVHLKKNNY